MQRRIVIDPVTRIEGHAKISIFLDDSGRVSAANPELARGGIRLRQFGQEIIEMLGGKKIHPAWVAPGGVRGPLTAEGREHIRRRLPEARATTAVALGLLKGTLDRFGEEVSNFGNFPTLYFGLVGDDGAWEHYGGHLRFVDAEGNVVADRLDPQKYRDYIGESVESDTY